MSQIQGFSFMGGPAKGTKSFEEFETNIITSLNPANFKEPKDKLNAITSRDLQLVIAQLLRAGTQDYKLDTAEVLAIVMAGIIRSLGAVGCGPIAMGKGTKAFILKMVEDIIDRNVKALQDEHPEILQRRQL